MQPTARPTIMLTFFKNGDPNISVNIIDTKDKNPNPINCGEPHLKGEKLSANMNGIRKGMNKRKRSRRIYIRT